MSRNFFWRRWRKKVDKKLEHPHAAWRKSRRAGTVPAGGAQFGWSAAGEQVQVPRKYLLYLTAWIQWRFNIDTPGIVIAAAVRPSSHITSRPVAATHPLWP